MGSFCHGRRQGKGMSALAIVATPPDIVDTCMRLLLLRRECLLFLLLILVIFLRCSRSGQIGRVLVLLLIPCLLLLLLLFLAFVDAYEARSGVEEGDGAGDMDCIVVAAVPVVLGAAVSH